MARGRKAEDPDHPVTVVVSTKVCQADKDMLIEEFGSVYKGLQHLIAVFRYEWVEKP